jgi:uncharacterized membrane protein HdeD (DUF308 family)
MSPLSTLSPAPPAPASPEELQALRRSWGWFLALGIAMVVLGTVAIGYACTVTITIAATWLFGIVLLASGVATVIGAFSAGRWSGVLVHVLLGVLYAVVGFMIIDRPVATPSCSR